MIFREKNLPQLYFQNDSTEFGSNRNQAPCSCAEERARERRRTLHCLAGMKRREGEERGIDVPRVGTAAGKWYGNIRVSQTVSSKAITSTMLNLQSGLNSWSLDPHLAITLGLIRISLSDVF